MRDTAVPTVRVTHEGFATGVLINAADFDPDAHRLHGVVPPRDPPPPATPPKPRK